MHAGCSSSSFDPTRTSLPAATCGRPVQVHGIRAMNLRDAMPSCSPREQVFLFERDAGLLCRILGLYAARGLDVLRADYAHAAQDLMLLKVSVAGAAQDADETLRVLTEKAATFAGVLAAAEQPSTA
jgi:hypothetical protein